MTQCSAVAGHDTRVLMSPRKSTPSSFVARHSLWSGAQARAAAVSAVRYELAVEFAANASTFRGAIGVEFTLGAGAAATAAARGVFLCFRGRTIHAMRLNGVAIAGATVNAAGTAITFTLPLTATNGVLSITARGGVGTSTLFQVDAAPTIASFTPPSGAPRRAASSAPTLSTRCLSFCTGPVSPVSMATMAA